ncbi:MAG: hypothetical protein LW628_14460 [Fimbriimonadaceae bacterium]|nr:hypothetical protein [Fimbriimonadaceae bacterium]
MGDIVKITSSNAHQIIDEMNDAAYQNRGNEPNLVIAQATEALKLAREWDYEKGIGHATRTIAAVEVRRKPSEGYILAMQAIEILEGCGDASPCKPLKSWKDVAMKAELPAHSWQFFATITT